ncbi:MAG: hypothetical protein COZ75_11900 [Flavobacteriaceae bacterium CG_4_8_14_3_um_filter_34_10]|nr:response regulator [Flavobacteriia bacterium]OIP49654.1 MAG: hypothetical protein AUK33_10020 [Flavobacteriaceae bacterium CG2_30_34_30]PIV48390.1 MAG: hypothetical protein COS19_14115 [Flavobacteriaceae bacterium CG02_land_8_20_14_3_00_34_13]PIX08467.1 MAG: hypothetical protein COZ75_11900 [Flavobacteriaceae bacterium CG_4_8_14_3_um_filter_34_10]PIZ09020.1 MAG: hypothetical protein COY56_00980 [Flavobacteriaceae bacterium CG_4_10_14_0_8_um_filter_34_31]PJC07754.1 MAG: hypothetical protein 
MNLKVLSVDDSSTIEKHLAYILKDLNGIKWVGHASSIKEAEALIISNNPDVVLLDIMVNEESGFDLLDSIKRNRKHIEVIMLSNLIDCIYIKKSKAMGAYQFIDKSFEFESIPKHLMDVYNKKYKNN